MLSRSLIKETGKRISSSRLYSNGKWMLFGRVYILFLGLAVSGLLARLLTPDAMGIFVFVESLVLTFAVFAQLGLGHTVVRLIARFVANKNTIAIRKTIWYVLQWGFLGSIIAAICLFLLGLQFAISRNVLVWACVWVVLFTSQKLLADIFRGFHDFRSVVLLDGSKIGGIITTSIAAVVLFIIWQQVGSLELEEVFPFLFIGGIPATLLAFVLLSRNVQLFGLSANGNEEKELTVSRKGILQVAFPVLITMLTTILLNRSGIWVITAFRSSAEVAIFGVVARLVAIVSMPMTFFETLISPTIVELYTNGKVQRLENLVRGITSILSLFSIFGFVAFALFGSDVLAFVYGDFYRAGIYVLILLVAGSVSSVISGPCGTTLVMTGNQNFLMVIDVASSVLSILLMLVWVEPYGMIGVASAVMLGKIVKNIAMLLSVKKLISIWTHLTLNMKKYVVFLDVLK